MAVSGRKTISPNTIWSGSDTNLCCDPCKGDGQNVKPSGYCEDCQEYLCNNCFTSHGKTKASRHHKLQERPGANDTFILDDKCQLHDNETIKFFCTVHKELGCHDCMVLQHRTCEVDYISDKCKGIAQSTEYDDKLKILDSYIQEVTNLETEIQENLSKADDYYTKALKDIDDFENLLISKIKAMKTEVVAKARTTNESTKQVLKTSLETCSTNLADMKQLQSCLRGVQDSKGEKELYIAFKKVESIMAKLNVRQIRRKNSIATRMHTFKRNTQLEADISKHVSLGQYVQNGFYQMVNLFLR